MFLYVIESNRKSNRKRSITFQSLTITFASITINITIYYISITFYRIYYINPIPGRLLSERLLDNELQ